MFQDLDSTIEAILNDPTIPASLVNLRDADKSFLTPDKIFKPGQPTVNLFLYEVKENRQLRDPRPIIEQNGNTFVQRQPPLRVDCCYLVTTWAIQPGAVNVADEHQLLAQALLWLSRFPTIPSNFLQGTLANQLYPPPTMVAQMEPQKDTGEFWLALGISPRPAFHLTVTIAMDLLLQVESPIVTTTITDYRLSEHPETGTGKPETSEIWVQIGGYVRLAGAPQPASFASALVTAIGGGGATVTVDIVTPFRVGDFVTKDNLSRAKITQIQNNNVLTLDATLLGLVVGDSLRIFQIEGAWVGLEDSQNQLQSTATTDEQGRFKFSKIQQGTYQLRVRAQGFGEVTQPITVPSTTAEYAVELN